MIHSTGWNTKAVLAMCACATAGAIVGCGQSDSGGAAGGTAGGGAPDATLIAAGKGVYEANGCARCHSLNGQGGGMGPDLSHTGAEASHTPQWLADHVKNPKTHNPGSRMPSFDGKINDKDLNALGAYLASLK